jgi:hypothetical protein
MDDSFCDFFDLFDPTTRARALRQLGYSVTSASSYLSLSALLPDFAFNTSIEQSWHYFRPQVLRDQVIPFIEPRVAMPECALLRSTLPGDVAFGQYLQLQLEILRLFVRRHLGLLVFYPLPKRL